MSAESTGAPASPRGEARIAEPTRQQRSVARRSAEIRATVPDADFRLVVEVSDAVAAAEAEAVPFFVLVLSAAARALAEMPHLNGAYRDGHLERYARVNLGVSVAGDGVYAVPTIFDSDLKTAPELASELADLRERALTDRLESTEQTGATFTVTDLGTDGLTSGAPLILGGQAGGLSVGALREVPVVRDGAIVAGREIVLTLAVDHRIVQAPEAGRFLAAVATGLEGAR